MLLKEMFAKPIDRDIKGVIKVGQRDEENISQELEEYVVTRELQKHFAEFFASYKKGINGNTDKMGVWISGFFGSGKSHFLKILSYLLANKEVNGKKALDYFIEDQKIKDPMVLADMRLASTVPTDVVLFNIDSKSEMSSKQSEHAIVAVFLKVFNEMQGFCGSIPILADLERSLEEVERYEEFKTLFEEEFGKTWEASRHKFDFIQDTVVDVLVEMGFMSEPAARNWCEKVGEPYNISIESFAKLVKDYLDRKGNNHHIAFLVDEIGQYIGDDSKLMLNLQTVAEDLGTACKGKVWIIVTSQQDIDSVTKTKGNDFSKIQGRFDTRLSLSSANVDEVIKKRILEKTPTAHQTLELTYEQEQTIIKNLIVFNDEVEKKLYSDKANFASIYPFVPYQFNLLASVLTSIRTHGASGKHLSEGERSMLALFKESAAKLINKEVGTLIPFNVFYDALHQFIDHSHSSVIIRAADNSIINPDHEENCFNVNVLKTLFMIKYVKEIKATAENITSLMVDNIHADRMSMKEKVDAALKVLVSQSLIQKHGEIYVFLTNEEQEINREIENQVVEMGDVILKASEVIFDDIFPDKKYRYPAFNGRYTFAFGQWVDDRPYRANQSHDIGVRILTPQSEYSGEDATLKMMSGQSREVLVVLPNDNTFLEETRVALKIEKFLKLNTATSLPKFEQIKDAKSAEMRECKERAKLFLIEALKNADIYVNGDKAAIGAKDVSARINEALSKLIASVYHKLEYITRPMNEASIRGLLKSSNQQVLGLEEVKDANVHALNDMLSYIADNSALHMKTSMKTLMERFMKAPYGFVEDDVEWLVAKLFKEGEIALTVNGSAVTLLNKSEDELVRYITKKEFVDKLLTERRQKANDKQKKNVKTIMKELFNTTSVADDDDAIMSSFKKYATNLMSDLEKYEMMYQNKAFPGKKVVAKAKNSLRSIYQVQAAGEFFDTLSKQLDDYLDLAEDLEPVQSFFAGSQKEIFETTLDLMAIYEESKTFIASPEIEAVVADIKGILTKEQPYKEIPKLPEYVEKFRTLYNALLTSLEEPIIETINLAKARIFEELENKPYKDQVSAGFRVRFEELYDKVEKCNNVAKLQSIKAEAEALKIRILNEMATKDEVLAKEAARKAAEEQKRMQQEKGIDGGGIVAEPVVPMPKVKTKKNISIRTVSPTISWEIETEQDVDKYLAQLKARILKELAEDTVVNIEF
ncbi:ATPase [Sporanaerobium hydrogeniformans]|uniref:ATPase n=1 Tax=Sporanaerobium hydrogeniformans TaxID=3072179 RepID=A0AC61D7Q3_9FIRM|nr:BREX system P-loop protein BrxC [Sporanaerobium hydrogeniformans]PHV69589.1 ATPase [Sporanaerobium hydrogeniformans]